MKYLSFTTCKVKKLLKPLLKLYAVSVNFWQMRATSIAQCERHRKYKRSTEGWMLLIYLKLKERKFSAQCYKFLHQGMIRESGSFSDYHNRISLSQEKYAKLKCGVSLCCLKKLSYNFM